MGDENLTPPSVAEMVRTTGANQSIFLDRIAQHIEKLEAEVIRLTTRVQELENGTNTTTD